VTGQRERVNQKRRTREALVDAAQQLLVDGRTPTVADVADEALVSRATAYRYFPSQEHLLLEVVLSRSIDQLDRAVKAATASDSAAERLDALVRTIHAEIAANEAGFRSLLSLSLARPDADGRPNVADIRGERRVHWIEHAIAPIRDELDRPSYRRLVSALTLCVGAEAYFVLRDLRGLDRAEAQETLREVARALLASRRRSA
jgi:AcrR family transcriptional regulator